VPVRVRRHLAGVVAATTLVACGGPAAAGGDAAADPDAAMLAALPDCDRVPLDADPEVTLDDPGLARPLPPGSRVTSVLAQGPLTMVEGTVEATPLEIRADFETRDDLEVLRIEDEVFETEVLTRADGHRAYVIAIALCDQASAVSVMIGPDSEETDLPEFRSEP
jgi:hypothetical protein